MLIHSCIYYELNSSIVDDHTWQRWADELVELHMKNPEHIKIGFYDDVFKDWTGATGNHLPHRDPWVYSKSMFLLDRFVRVGNTVPDSPVVPDSPIGLDQFFS